MKEMVGCFCTQEFDLADSCTSMAIHTPIKGRCSSPVVRTLAYHAAGPGSIPGLGEENY